MRVKSSVDLPALIVIDGKQVTKHLATITPRIVKGDAGSKTTCYNKIKTLELKSESVISCREMQFSES